MSIGQPRFKFFAHQFFWVNRPPTVPNFIVEVRSRASARGPHESNHLSALDDFTLLHEELGVVGEAGDIAVAVVHHDKFTIASFWARKPHPAVSRGGNRCSGGIGYVQSVVKAGAFWARREAEPVTGGGCPFCRPAKRGGAEIGEGT